MQMLANYTLRYWDAPWGYCFQCHTIPICSYRNSSVCDMQGQREAPTVFKDGVPPPIKIYTTIWELKKVLGKICRKKFRVSLLPPE